MSRLVYVIYVFRYDTAAATATLEDSYTGLPLSSWSAVVVVLGKSRHATLLYIFWLAVRPPRHGCEVESPMPAATMETSTSSCDDHFLSLALVASKEYKDYR